MKKILQKLSLYALWISFSLTIYGCGPVKFSYGGRAKFPLESAVETGKIDQVEALIQQEMADKGEFNINRLNERGEALIHVACEAGDQDMLAFLLSKGADLNQRDECNRTPFYLMYEAAIKTAKGQYSSFRDDCQNVVNFFMDNGVNAKYEYGVFILACMHGDLGLVKSLIEKGVLIGVEVVYIQDAVNAAVRNGQASVVKFLIDQQIVDIQDCQKAFLILNCIEENRYQGSLELAWFLIDRGIKLDANVADQALYHVCADLHFPSSARRAIITWLVQQQNIDIDQISPLSDSSTPLQAACQALRLDLVQDLISCRADVNATALLYACQGAPKFMILEEDLIQCFPQRLAIARMLIGHGAPLSDKTTLTLLWEMACRIGDLDFVQLLVVDNGVDINHRYSDISMHRGSHYKVPQALATERKGKYYTTPLLMACEYGQLAIVKYLIEKGADINGPDETGFMPIHMACQNGYLEIVKELVSKGAVTNRANNENKTPLKIATEKGHPAIVSYLQERASMQEE